MSVHGSHPSSFRVGRSLGYFVRGMRLVDISYASVRIAAAAAVALASVFTPVPPPPHPPAGVCHSHSRVKPPFSPPILITC